ncbi:MAG: Ig-like domain-containing protein [Saprospiraceae bacterium]
MVLVTGVSVNPSSSTLYESQTVLLTASVTPTNAANQGVSWTSSAPAIATVNANGVVTAISEGTAVVTVTTNQGGFTATAIINVLSHCQSLTL